MMRPLIVCLGFGISLALSLPTQAQQVLPDGTINTIVTRTNNDFTITGGTPSGSNLFHSFREFSIPTSGSAFFDNAATVQNIFSRVTGGSVSNIDGMIRANGTANLFLLNPNGILFGANASLNIGGSFIGTTASSIQFADSVQFSAVNPTETPLLTMSAPIGLQMGTNPANIQVNHTGHLLTAPFVQRISRGNTPLGLSVATGKTLALVGGNVTLTGGILNAPDGRVEIGAVTLPDLVALNPNPLGWTLDYGNIPQFGNIQLGERSLVEASNTGAIRLFGNNISLQDGSLLLLENHSTQPAIGVELHATGTVGWVGSTPNSGIRSGVISDARSSGAGGNIAITADRIMARENGGGLRSYTFGNATSGNINLNAKEVTMFGGDRLGALVETRTLGAGNSGNLTISTERMIAQAATFISSVRNGPGNAGNIDINATESIILEPSSSAFQTLISAAAVGARGNAGNITINTPRLALRGGAVISSATYGEGNAGQITLNIAKSLELSGVGINAQTRRIEPTTIRTGGILVPLATRQALNLPDQITGNARDIVINTPNLSITDSALISVSHDSLGNAGRLSINADALQLNTGGKITATTASGEGGNISLNLRESLLMRNGSFINTEAKGTGNGGNIMINAPIILGLENSDIIANAIEGRGGEINITTQGIIGLAFHNTPNPRANLTNDITASSGIGLDGSIAIENIGVDPNSGLIALPVSLSDPSQKIAKGCSVTQGSEFVVTGRGGIPHNPSERAIRNRSWQDLRVPEGSQSSNVQSPSMNAPLIEATSWSRNPQKGKVELTAAKPVQPDLTATCTIASPAS